jgi:SAM-dependent methyltransferase
MPMLPKLYDQLAQWWPLLSPPSDYAEEAEFYAAKLLAAGTKPALTLLELGSGGGNNASYLKKHFQMTLVDLSPGMLAVSRALNPECTHLQGDMRTVRLGRQFDRVFIHDAICYMTTLSDLRKAVESAYIHCRPGGAALFAPDYLKETFRTGDDHGGTDDRRRGLRYLEWTWDPDPADSAYTVDFAYLLRNENGDVSVEHDRHIEGLFARGEWRDVLTSAGFQAESVRFDHSDLPPGLYELFLAVK